MQAPLGFRCSSLALFNCGNFDSPFGLPQDDQVGGRLWMYTWYRFADIKNGYGRFWNCGAKTKSADGF